MRCTMYFHATIRLLASGERFGNFFVLVGREM
jgi:hypothetical protein